MRLRLNPAGDNYRDHGEGPHGVVGEQGGALPSTQELLMRLMDLADGNTEDGKD